ncbi:sensor histidine kinase [Pseudosulfitobacter pseudonitzschiae]|uniref:sensor histidine kinase n=1 Tax=Pseudosulfitobacter pseudonitzschiae TaxID=1402135 RepID=UPI001CCB9BE2|nr:ATPase [Pseudosulfitobacter pseudonitzschiae]MCA0138145.1 ATPase [Pseudosulfitobacter pseudonitzschiae]MCD2329732.1 ATPase [Pseudosulfitobacter pseudonitzschiae]MCD2354151.1 ATPase [Pseudosulfitobacter pseudonitzschiae]MCI2213198.1 ATPase [Pseudosulfitobacter pseudonitzschiae]UFE30857.1 ATPase [Pseudosulfitobacter pseudonitzschiae]
MVVAEISRASSLNQDLVGSRLISLSGEEQQAIPITVHDLIEEPDTIANPAKLRAFYDTQNRLYSALRTGPVKLDFVQSDGSEIVNVRALSHRPISELPVRYWTQIFVAFVGVLIGTWVAFLRPRDLAAWLYLLSGVGLALSSASAALYSTRELALSWPVFSMSSRLNSIGALLFGVGMVTLFLSYPLRLVPRIALALPAILVGGCIVFVQVLNWPDNLVRMKDLITVTMGILLLVIAAQVIANRRDPAARAMLGWLGLSVVVGAGGFVLTTIIPRLFLLEPVLEQSTAFLLFLIIYAGTAMAVTRYRLFDLANWSFGFLFYGVGVALLLGLDATLIYGLSVDRLPAFSIALAMTGLLYLPLRDKIWGMFRRNRQIQAEELYQRVTEIAHSKVSEQRYALVRKLWSDVFNPLQISVLDDPATRTALHDDGRALTLAPAGELPALSLRLAGQGAHLFSSRDLARAKVILSLLDTSLLQHATYLQAVSTERIRINRDMHDNIGVLLLSALHTNAPDRKDLLIRQTLTDLRELISNPDKPDWQLRDLLADLRIEIISHFEAANISVTWQADDVGEVRISHRLVNTLRAVLREGTSNILRHAGATVVRVEIGFTTDGLNLMLSDNGSGFDSAIVPLGNGFRNLENRIAQLGGCFIVNTSVTGTILTASLPFCSDLYEVAE